MKFSALALGALALSASANAQYFSQGWMPGAGAPAPSAATTSKGYIPGASVPPAPIPTARPTATAQAAFSMPTKLPTIRELSELLDLTNLFALPPVVALAAKFGINVTEKLEEVRARRYWDERIPLITDENYESMIVDEVMTPEEEAERVWFAIITVTASSPEGVSKFTDSVFDSAYNLTQEAGDLKNVRWARIDYLNVTRITTKWNVWSAPYIMIITNRGQDLRFWKANQVRLNDDTIRTFLKEEGWRQTAPWKSSFGPGGEWEWIMEHFANSLAFSYNGMLLLPKWLLYVITGALGSVIISFLHRSETTGPKPEVKAKTEAKTAAAKIESAPEASAASPSPKKKGGAKKRQGKKASI